MELPEYVCHKKVRAAQIVGIIHAPGRHGIAKLDLGDYGNKIVEVTEDWIREKKAEPLGYYVVYDDGYASFSPAAAFEAGYTPVEPTALELGAAVRKSGLQGP